ncbi:tetratricopeptide repeat protein 31-like protein [Leptotrombidium deliense]|uniref:Tetratricopeptide repeat protein 31-like protein n=1 Tax=Leptotrombidium deliense TaxID=299467 RepID=A0A443SQD3_9ACAR|nr:tetratricopeptide repeat protein 31-like protein [Leptotrombidium deliense]
MCDNIIHSGSTRRIDNMESFVYPSNVEESKKVAIRAAECIKRNEVFKAVELYTQAIALNPYDFVFHEKKASCFEILGWMDDALHEIDVALYMEPTLDRLLFRKAKVLRRMSKFEESEKVLNSIDENCFDFDALVLKEERQCLIRDAIIHYGFPKELAIVAAQEYNNISNAFAHVMSEELKRLLPKQRSYADVTKENPKDEHHDVETVRRDSISSIEPIYRSDSPICQSAVSHCPIKKKEYEENKCTNLMGYKGLWVGNVSLQCNKEKLAGLVKKYGNPSIHWLQKTTKSCCIFVKFDNEESPTRLIQDLHGKLLPDIAQDPTRPLKFHFDCNQQQLVEKFPKNRLPRTYANGECYFWRTTGCSSKCGKRHVPINAGIDLQQWMNKGKPMQNRQN